MPVLLISVEYLIGNLTSKSGTVAVTKELQLSIALVYLLNKKTHPHLTTRKILNLFKKWTLFI